MAYHVAYVTRSVMQRIISARKTCEIRLSERAHPARSACPNDRLIFKESGGPVFGVAHVWGTLHYSGVTPVTLAKIERMVRYDMAVEDREYFQAHENANYASVLLFQDFTYCTLPDEFTPHGDQIGWVADFAHARHLKVS